MLNLFGHRWTDHVSLFSSETRQLLLQLQDPPPQFDTVGAEGGGGFLAGLVLLLFLLNLQVRNVKAAVGRVKPRPE